MWNLYSHLSTEHHLRYVGREHLTSFLKGAGLDLTNALLFWKYAFAPKNSEADFEKKYAYNIKHK
jgi:DNA primase large subunit